MVSLRAAAIVAFLFGGTAAAQANLLTNGGFETGDFTGWTVEGPYFGSAQAISIPTLGDITANSIDIPGDYVSYGSYDALLSGGDEPFGYGRVPRRGVAAPIPGWSGEIRRPRPAA